MFVAKKIAATILSATLIVSPSIAAGLTVLNNSNHVGAIISNALTTLGTVGVTVDQTEPNSAPTVFLGQSIFIANSVNSAVVEYNAVTSVPTPLPNANVPYGVLSQSSTGYTLAGFDQGFYDQLTTNAQVFSMAYCGTPTASDYPPIAFATILPNNFASNGTFTPNTCGYAVGIEFSMTLGYKGFNTGSASATTGDLAAIVASVKASHPTWTWGDVKGSLRQTASNWAAGYAAKATPGGVTSFGFGNVDYDSAVAIASTASIFLQGPGVKVTTFGLDVMVTMYPFRQTRRAYEVVYSVSPAYVWPIKNEYTAADLAASGGSQVCSTQGNSATTPICEFSVGAAGTLTLVPFTTDGAGGFSRVESYTEKTVSVAAVASCTILQ